MSKPERFWSFLTTFNGLETSLEILNTNQIFTDLLFLTYFLQRKIRYGIISSSVLSICQKMQKCLK